jgi:hypothetical protein
MLKRQVKLFFLGLVCLSAIIPAEANWQIGAGSFNLSGYSSVTRYHIGWYPIKLKKWQLGCRSLFLGQNSVLINQQTNLLSLQFNIWEPEQGLYINYSSGYGNFFIFEDKYRSWNKNRPVTETIIGNSWQLDDEKYLKLEYLKGKMIIDSRYLNYDGLSLGFQWSFIAHNTEKTQNRTTVMTEISDEVLWPALATKYQRAAQEHPQDQELQLTKEAVEKHTRE